MARMATSSVIGLGGEVPGRLEQRLAEHVGGHAGVAAQRVGHPLLAEELLAGPGLGQAVGVEEAGGRRLSSGISRLT